MVGTTASLVSFPETEELLRTLAGVEVGAKQVERAAEASGREIDADERAVVHSGAPVSDCPAYRRIRMSIRIACAVSAVRSSSCDLKVNRSCVNGETHTVISGREASSWRTTNDPSSNRS